MKRKPRISQLIKGAAARCNYSMLSLSIATGIPYATLNRRLENPGGWKLCELSAVFKKIVFLPEEAEEIRKEVGLV